MASETWLVVGLGNPGEKYRSTRHNAGFRVLERLGQKRGVSFREKDKALLASYPFEGREIFLMLPLTFMNESGHAVAPFMRYRQVPPERLLVVSDDLDLPVGRIRLRMSGGTGGHHGLDSIAAHLQSTGFPRLRLGIGKPLSADQGPDHVLSSFSPDEKSKMEKAEERAVEGIERFIERGAEVAMRELNGELPAP